MLSQKKHEQNEQNEQHDDQQTQQLKFNAQFSYAKSPVKSDSPSKSKNLARYGQAQSEQDVLTEHCLFRHFHQKKAPEFLERVCFETHLNAPLRDRVPTQLFEVDCVVSDRLRRIKKFLSFLKSNKEKISLWLHQHAEYLEKKPEHAFAWRDGLHEEDEHHRMMANVDLIVSAWIKLAQAINKLSQIDKCFLGEDSKRVPLFHCDPHEFSQPSDVFCFIQQFLDHSFPQDWISLKADLPDHQKEVWWSLADRFEKNTLMHGRILKLIEEEGDPLCDALEDWVDHRLQDTRLKEPHSIDVSRWVQVIKSGYHEPQGLIALWNFAHQLVHAIDVFFGAKQVGTSAEYRLIHLFGLMKQMGECSSSLRYTSRYRNLSDHNADSALSLMVKVRAQLCHVKGFEDPFVLQPENACDLLQVYRSACLEIIQDLETKREALNAMNDDDFKEFLKGDRLFSPCPQAEEFKESLGCIQKDLQSFVLLEEAQEPSLQESVAVCQRKINRIHEVLSSLKKPHVSETEAKEYLLETEDLIAKIKELKKSPVSNHKKLNALLKVLNNPKLKEEKKYFRSWLFLDGTKRPKKENKYSKMWNEAWRDVMPKTQVHSVETAQMRFVHVRRLLQQILKQAECVRRPSICDMLPSLVLINTNMMEWVAFLKPKLQLDRDDVPVSEDHIRRFWFSELSRSRNSAAHQDRLCHEGAYAVPLVSAKHLNDEVLMMYVQQQVSLGHNLIRATETMCGILRSPSSSAPEDDVAQSFQTLVLNPGEKTKSKRMLSFSTPETTKRSRTPVREITKSMGDVLFHA